MSSSVNCEFYFCVDDSALVPLVTGKDIGEIEKILEWELSSINQWLQLTNYRKCYLWMKEQGEVN